MIDVFTCQIRIPRFVYFYCFNICDFCVIKQNTTQKKVQLQAFEENNYDLSEMTKYTEMQVLSRISQLLPSLLKDIQVFFFFFFFLLQNKKVHFVLLICRIAKIGYLIMNGITVCVCFLLHAQTNIHIHTHNFPHKLAEQKLFDLTMYFHQVHLLKKENKLTQTDIEVLKDATFSLREIQRVIYILFFDFKLSQKKIKYKKNSRFTFKTKQVSEDLTNCLLKNN